MAQFWRNCSSCKREINFSTRHYLCSVTTCNQKRSNYVFCSVPCFERHLPGARHKDAWAEEATSPAEPQRQDVQSPTAARTLDADGGARRRIVTSQPSSQTMAHIALNSEILVVVSKLKSYIKTNYDFNTAGDVMSRLSDMIRQECDRAVEQARADGRKTIMARDFK